MAKQNGFMELSRKRRKRKSLNLFSVLVLTLPTRRVSSCLDARRKAAAALLLFLKHPVISDRIPKVHTLRLVSDHLHGRGS